MKATSGAIRIRYFFHDLLDGRTFSSKLDFAPEKVNSRAAGEHSLSFVMTTDYHPELDLCSTNEKREGGTGGRLAALLPMCKAICDIE